MGFPVFEPWRAEPGGYPQNWGPRDEATGGTHPKAGSTCSRGKEGAGVTHCPAMRVSHQGGVPRQPPLPLPQRLFEKIFPTLPPQPGWWEPWGTQAAPQRPTRASAMPETSGVPGEGAWIPESLAGRRGQQVNLRRGLPGSWGPTRSCSGCQGKGARFIHATGCVAAGPGTGTRQAHMDTVAQRPSPLTCSRDRDQGIPNCPKLLATWSRHPHGASWHRAPEFLMGLVSG